MRLVGDVIAQLHLEAGTKELAVGDGGGRVPDLDDVEVPLGRDGHTRNHLVVCLQELVRHAVDHAVYKDRVGVGGVHLLGLGTALVVLGSIPQRSDALAHEEEHA